MIIVAGTISVKPGYVAEVYAYLTAMCDSTRKEPGCQFYHMAMEGEPSGRILALEGWDDRQSLDVHLVTPQITEFLAKFGNCVSTDVQIHEVSNSTAFT